MNATLLDIRMNDLTQVLTKLHGRMGNLGSKLTTVITRLKAGQELWKTKWLQCNQKVSWPMAIRPTLSRLKTDI